KGPGARDLRRQCELGRHCAAPGQTSDRGSTPAAFVAEIPEDAADNDECAEIDHSLQRLAIEEPADRGDQRYAQEVDGHDNAGVTVAQGVGQAEVRGQAAEGDAECRKDLAATELGQESRVAG